MNDTVTDDPHGTRDPLAADAADEPEAIGVEVRGRIGYLELDRPAARNALTLNMVERLAQGLDAHLADDRVQAIVIRSRDPRAFSAGGDMKRLRLDVLAAEQTRIDRFLEAEYALNLAIARAGKPYVAVLDGIAMGGGLGLSVHGSHRLVTERATLATPEARIGLFPDVGGTWFLPRLPRAAGYWLALASASLDGHEAIAVGLATHAIRSSDLATLYARLESDETTIEAVIDAIAVDPDRDAIDAALEHRAPWFEPAPLDVILRRLHDATERGDPDAAALLQRLETASPQALRTTLALFDGAESRDLELSLTREFAAMREAVRHPDFAEGVRALLVDKDRAPRWGSVPDTPA